MYKPIQFNLIIFKLIFLLLHDDIFKNASCLQQSTSETKQMSVNEDLVWSLKDLQNINFSQVPGIAINKSQLNIFHRSTVVWDQNSFDNDEIYLLQNQPIIVDPILTFDLSGHLISSWGKNHFFMPHGLSFDPDGNIWLTDVALHQVFRFNKNNLIEPDLVLGKRFIPGNDENHFCKPTDVQVSSRTKFVFISDGYCNSRVMVFDEKGRFIKQFGTEQNMAVSHSLSLIEELDLICVADRENSRIFCYNSGIKEQSKLGKLEKELKFQSNSYHDSMFAIQNIGTFLFGVVKQQSSLLNSKTRGVLYDLTKDKDELVWQDDLLLNSPHDITIDSENNLYISEIDTKSSKFVKKFSINIPKMNDSPRINIRNFQNDARIEKIRPKSKRIDDTKTQEDDLKDLKNLQKESTTTQSNKAERPIPNQSTANDTTKIEPKRTSLLIFILFISSLLLISIILFVLKKRIGIENYFRSLGLPTKVVYSKDLHINDPERCGFNLLREEEENLFDFELENNSSESEVEEFNFKHMRKV